MMVGLLTVQLQIGDSQSLKDKRQALRSLKDRLRHGFNVSLSEVGAQDLWQRAELGIACVGTDTAGVNRVLSQVVNTIEQDRAISMIDYQLEML